MGHEKNITPDGFGTLIQISKKQVYWGYFKEGFKQGYGQIFFNKGGHFEGYFENDKKNGWGVY